MIRRRVQRLATVASWGLVGCARTSSPPAPLATAVAASETPPPVPTSALASAAPTDASPPPAPLATRATGPWGIAVAPDDVSIARPLIVYLHGMWASPEDSCSFFERAAHPRGFLVCPRGTTKLSYGGTWTGPFAAIRARVDEATAHAEDLGPGAVAHDGGTLLGFSIGAKGAVDIALAEPGRWTGLVVMSMDLRLDATKLAAAGVKRIVLAAADDDGARLSMQRTTAALVAAGFDARFVSLGRVGHHFPKDMDTKMDDAVGWVRGE